MVAVWSAVSPYRCKEPRAVGPPSSFRDASLTFLRDLPCAACGSVGGPFSYQHRSSISQAAGGPKDSPPNGLDERAMLHVAVGSERRKD